MLLEQALIQAKVPFDIIFDDNLRDLSKYRVLVLADQECLGDEQLELIRKFVQRGGGLVATEHSSLYTEWRRRKRDFGLKGLLQVEAPPWRGADGPEELLKLAPVRHQVGSGRVAYLPEVRPAIEKPPAAPMTSEYWKLPLNWKEFVSAVKWAANGNLSLEVTAPITLAAELMEQKQVGKLLVHLINYNAERNPVVSNIEVNLRAPEGRRAEQVFLLSPDEARAQPLTFTQKEQRVLVHIPHLKTYSLLVVRLGR
jgi:hypothetical protein